MVRQVSSDLAVMFSGSHYAGAGRLVSGCVAACICALQSVVLFSGFGDSVLGYGSSSQSPATGYPMLLENKPNENSAIILFY